MSVKGCERNPFACKLEISVAFSNLETLKNLPINTYLSVDLNTGKLDQDRSWWYFASKRTDVVNAIEQTFEMTMGIVNVHTNNLVANAYLKLDRVGNTYKNYFGEEAKGEFKAIEKRVKPFVIGNIKGDVRSDDDVAQIVYKNLTPQMREKVDEMYRK